jgi:hypothetical protein
MITANRFWSQIFGIAFWLLPVGFLLVSKIAFLRPQF